MGKLQFINGFEVVNSLDDLPKLGELRYFAGFGDKKCVSVALIDIFDDPDDYKVIRENEKNYHFYYCYFADTESENYGKTFNLSHIGYAIKIKK